MLVRSCAAAEHLVTAKPRAAVHRGHRETMNPVNKRSTTMHPDDFPASCAGAPASTTRAPAAGAVNSDVGNSGPASSGSAPDQSRRLVSSQSGESGFHRGEKMRKEGDPRQRSCRYGFSCLPAA